MGNKNNNRKKKRQQEKKKNKTINKQLVDEKKKNSKKEFKMLLLGTGDSGKSTFVKQMQILYKGGFNTKIVHLYKNIIRINLKQHMKSLLKASTDLGIPLPKESVKIQKKFLELIKLDAVVWNDTIIDMIKKLWNEPQIKECYKSRHLFQLPDSSALFFEKIDEIAKEDYEPTQEDILNCRIPTTGVKELTFTVKNYIWNLVDVGGQRSERRKWIHHFADVDILIFVIALDSYSQKLFEEHSVNRMTECISVFEQTVNNEFFKKKRLVILLNKIDLFKEKLKKVKIKEAFPDYEGENDFEHTSEYFKNKFLDIVNHKKRSVSTHLTCGTDTIMIEKIFDDIRISIMEKFITTYL
ncbi:guanine nucleotide-binding protein g(o) subunit alpha [Anaeramoeba flamelloides]|uniref:Guanine nucleotide-binding protein g(O) subunit alpha n=1 Tax=Anaeramoeba flamelloides TaxID=1746091 RepID=A0AAV7Y9R4_9EUKA|nr:guanine nucleotide-binding protein g(o) subunit alpha [Anaeramoeba flamelloides]KAJ6228217.1 guanine nucleotide-binding protein g(o) subunit alpha [Anaeramoeba flamelloides]